MPANTPHGYPYPLGTDRVADGDDVIHSLATAVDTQLGVVASGSVTIPIVTAGTTASVAVTFPSGRFNVAPIVAMALTGTAPQTQFATPSGVSTTGFTANGNRPGGTANVTAAWSAWVI